MTKQQLNLTIQFHRDRGRILVPIHRGAVNMVRYGEPPAGISNNENTLKNSLYIHYHNLYFM